MLYEVITLAGHHFLAGLDLLGDRQVPLDACRSRAAGVAEEAAGQIPGAAAVGAGEAGIIV